MKPKLTERSERKFRAEFYPALLAKIKHNKTQEKLKHYKSVIGYSKK